VVWERAGVDSDVGVLVTAAAMYAVAGGLALRIPRDLLGPDVAAPRPPVREAVQHVVAGLVAGLRHLDERRPAAYGLTAIGLHRFLFGISTVSMILLYRNYFFGPGQEDAALAQLSLAVVLSGAGFVLAAFVTPVVTERVPQRTWVVTLLLFAAVTQLFPGGLYTRPALLVAAFCLGLASQGVKIVVDTLVQTTVDDEFRGRVFSLYDVIFNVAFVAAAAVAAVVLPDTGKSYVVLVATAVGFALTALWYARVTRTRAPVGAAGQVTG
jgi:MFS family permease